ncbi:hypothetical protein HK097_010322 [Rhizophlyctis rosea]|uniref:Uncharacterized protein n=1 Tax=Rhizophlyctis rosea TaxID=64517 RepID=A0AAD5S7T0_9FUNG|nr:hypothetical protein HK097_010322 [Rhizophlyctis rosea]
MPNKKHKWSNPPPPPYLGYFQPPASLGPYSYALQSPAVNAVASNPVSATQPASQGSSNWHATNKRSAAGQAKRCVYLQRKSQKKLARKQQAKQLQGLEEDNQRLEEAVRQSDKRVEEEKARSKAQEARWQEERRQLAEKLGRWEKDNRRLAGIVRLEATVRGSEEEERRWEEAMERLEMDKRGLEKDECLEDKTENLSRRLNTLLRSIKRWYPYLDPATVEAFLGSIDHRSVDNDTLTEKNKDMIKTGEDAGYTHEQVQKWIADGDLFLVDESMNVQFRLNGQSFDDDPSLTVYNSYGVPKALFPLITEEDREFIRQAYHLICKMRRNLAGLRKGLLGGTMYAYGIRAGFVSGVRFGRYAFEHKHLKADHVWNLVIKLERDLALALANIGRSFFPWTWERNIQIQLGLETNGMGDDVPGVGGNVTITFNYRNTLHTDKDGGKDGGHAWGLWAHKDLVRTGEEERKPKEIAMYLKGVPHLIFPEFGVAVKLYDGVMLDWDSGKIKHATSETIWKEGYKGEFAVIGSSTQWADALMRRADPNRGERIVGSDEHRDETFEKLWRLSHRQLVVDEEKARGKGKGMAREGTVGPEDEEVVAEHPSMETYLDKDLAAAIAADGSSPWKDLPEAAQTLKEDSPEPVQSSKRKAEEPETCMEWSVRKAKIKAIEATSKPVVRKRG